MASCLQIGWLLRTAMFFVMEQGFIASDIVRGAKDRANLSKIITK